MVKVELPDLKLHVWYMDDGTIGGKLPDLHKDIDILVEDGAHFQGSLPASPNPNHGSDPSQQPLASSNRLGKVWSSICVWWWWIEFDK